MLGRPVRLGVRGVGARLNEEGEVDRRRTEGVGVGVGKRRDQEAGPGDRGARAATMFKRKMDPGAWLAALGSLGRLESVLSRRSEWMRGRFPHTTCTSTTWKWNVVVQSVVGTGRGAAVSSG